MPHNSGFSYIVCTTQRSGSTFLCDLLAATGAAGRPREYFLDDWRKRIADRPYLELPADAPIDFLGYLERVVEKTTSGNGVFGLKILAPNFFSVLKKLQAHQAYRELSDAEAVAAVFPGVKYIWLTRRDKIRQAISLLNARQSGVWNSNQLPAGQRFVQTALTNEGIDIAVRTLVDHEAQWQEFFTAGGVEPLALVYEDMVQDPARAVKQIFDYLGVPYPEAWRPENASVKAPITRPDVEIRRAEYLAYTSRLTPQAAISRN